MHTRRNFSSRTRHEAYERSGGICECHRLPGHDGCGRPLGPGNTWYEQGTMLELPDGAVRKGGKVYDASGRLIEVFEGRWCLVKNGERSGWWRFNDHYDRQGYCDNPGRGY